LALRLQTIFGGRKRA